MNAYRLLGWLTAVLALPGVAARPPHDRVVPVDGVLVGPDSLFRKLSGRLQGPALGRPLRVLQIGDSHSANGFFAAELAARIAPSGGIAPSFHAPYHRGLLMGRMEFSPGWERSTWLQPVDNGSNGPSGTAAITRLASASVRLMLSAAAPRGSRVTFWWSAPEGTRAAIRVDGGAPLPVRVGRADANVPMAHLTIGLPEGAKQISLEGIQSVRGEAVRFFGASVDRRDAPLTYDVLGLGGATHAHALLRQAGALSQFLDERAPDVLLVWFGTNSVVDPRIDEGRFTREYGALVDSLRAHAPLAQIVLIGPPDFARPDVPCRSLDPCAMRSGGCYPVSHPNVPIVRDLIKAVAASRGAVFFDVYRSQGKRGGMLRGHCAIPPTVQRDLVHMTEAGYRGLAQVFWSALPSRR